MNYFYATFNSIEYLEFREREREREVYVEMENQCKGFYVCIMHVEHRDIVEDLFAFVVAHYQIVFQDDSGIRR